MVTLHLLHNDYPAEKDIIYNTKKQSTHAKVRKAMIFNRSKTHM